MMRNLHPMLAAGLLLAGGLPSAAGAAAAEPPCPRAADFRLLASDYVQPSGAFSRAARKEALRRLAALEKRACGMNPLPMYLAVAGIAALADNGHDSVMRGERTWQPKLRLPLRTIWFDDGLFIARAGPPHADLAGAEILAVGGQSTRQVMRKLRTIQGGTDGYRRWQTWGLLSSTEALHALGLAIEPDKAKLRVRLRSGKVEERAIAGIPPSDLPKQVRPERLWSAGPLPMEAEHGWADAAPDAPVPLYLQEPDRWFRMAELPELKALYVQFRSNMDEGEERIAPFVAKVTERLQKDPPDNFVLDLRYDTGGDSTKTLDLMKLIAERVRGRIYLLTGNYTFSAGIVSAAALKRHAGERVTVIGAPAGDRLRWWSEGKSLCLPESGLCVRTNYGLWDLERGCARDSRCFGDRFGINGATIEPRLRAPILSRHWFSGVDPAMDAMARDLRLHRVRR